MLAMTSRPTLHLTVGLPGVGETTPAPELERANRGLRPAPGVGKTTLARELERANGALRLTPDEWMAPLFGSGMAGGKRDILEGRLIWVAHQVLRAGVSVILDFGCWSADERQALRAIADLSD